MTACVCIRQPILNLNMLIKMMIESYSYGNLKIVSQCYMISFLHPLSREHLSYHWHHRISRKFSII